MIIKYKEIFKGIENFHIFGVCVVNEHLFAKKISEDFINRDAFIKSIFKLKNLKGINAMSISDITGIPRATVIRKLKRLVNKKSLKIDSKKLYRTTDNLTNKLTSEQRNNIIKLANFSSQVYNLSILHEEISKL